MHTPVEESKTVHRHLRAARRAIASGKPARALAPLSRALAADPHCAYAWFFRAGVRVLRGDLNAAAGDLNALSQVPISKIVRYREFDAPSALRYPRYLAAVDRLLARPKPPAWGFALRAFGLRESHRFPQAIAAMERAVAAAPRDAALRAILSRVRFVNRFPSNGLSELNAALRLAPSCGWLHAWKGEALRHLGRPREALTALETAIKLDPYYFRAFAWRGGIRSARGRDDLALADLTRALKNAPPDEPSLSWIYNERMRVRRALGDIPGALSDLNIAHGMNSRYGWARPGGRDFSAADEELSRFLRRRPGHAWARAWRGHTKLEHARPADALADLDAAITAGLDRGWPLLWRGRARLMLGDTPGALRDLSKAVRAEPRHAPAWAWRGGARRLQGPTLAARADLTRAIELEPILAWAWAWRGELNLAAGRHQDALDDLGRALILDPDNHDARLWRAEAYRRLKLFAQAACDAEDARRRQPDSWRAWAALSVIRGDRRDLAGQRRALTRALALAPSQARAALS